MGLKNPVVTAKVGNNADLLPDILKIHVKDGSVIADVTFGKGVFWKNVDVRKYWFLPSDIKTGVDCRNLPYGDGSIDCVVIDPPYAGSNDSKNTAHIMTRKDDQYGLLAVRGRKAVQSLYREGILESLRVLRKGGVLIIKCQDEISGGKQYWNHCELMLYAEYHGFITEDLFVLVQKGTPIMRHDHQLHARKNHSYFIVFKKK